MKNNCALACQSCDADDMTVETKNTLEVVGLSIEYLQKEGISNSDCKNNFEECFTWASFGECENNKEFMGLQCSLACRSCL